ncbi:MAG TPA: hypothetical protein VFV05_12430 [Methylomirabilota bacterium]|nr:hypothetical protein [Methylomirabilota bacterium]
MQLRLCARLLKQLDRQGVLGHLGDDRLELERGVGVLAAPQELLTALQRRRQCVRLDDPSLQRLDAARELGLERTHRRQAGPLVDGDGRLVVDRSAGPFGQGRLELEQPVALPAKARAHLLRLVDEAALHVLELGAHLLEILETLVRLLAHRALDDGGQVRGNGRVHLGQGGGLLGPELLEELHGIVAGERRPQAEQLVGDRADREDVGPMVGPTAHLLGSNVAQRPHDETRARETALGRGDLGDAKVEDLHLPVAQQHDVAGLDVTVDDASLVRVVQPVADLHHDGQLVLEGQSFPLGDELPKLVAFQQLHDEEEPSLVLPHVVDGDDVGVTQPSARLGFAEESGAELVGDVRVGRDDLEGDETVQDRVAGLVDQTHATPSYALDDLVLANLLGHALRGPSAARGPRVRSRIGRESR